MAMRDRSTAISEHFERVGSIATEAEKDDL